MHIYIYVTWATHFFICKILLFYAPHIGSITELEDQLSTTVILQHAIAYIILLDCPTPRMASQPAVIVWIVCVPTTDTQVSLPCWNLGVYERNTAQFKRALGPTFQVNSVKCKS